MSLEKHKKILNLVLLLLLLVSMVTFPFIGVSAQDKGYGGTLVAVVGNDPSQLNPALHLFDVCQQISNQIYNGLVSYDEQYNVLPDLAESWEISEDGLTYTFNLVENVKWHDNKPFTSADVKYTLESIKEFGAQKNRLSSVESIETPDDKTVILHLSEIYAPLLSDLAGGGFFILPKHLFEGTEWETNQYSSNPIGTGPFKFLEWVKMDHVTIVSNPDYFKGRPYLDKIIFKVIPEATTAIAAFEAGEVDFITATRGLSYAEVTRFRDMEDVYLTWSQSTAYWSVGFNLDNEYLSNLKVRQAIAHAVDRDKIVEVAYSGVPGVAITDCPFSPVVDWSYNWDAKFHEYDPIKSEQLLDEAMYPKGSDGWRFSLKMDFVDYYPGDLDMWLMIKDMLENIGIKIELVQTDWSTHYQKVLRKDPSIEIIWAWGGGADPNVFERFYVTNSTHNYFMYSNPRVDELFAMGTQTADLAERAEIYLELGGIIAEEIPRFPVWSPRTTQAVKAEYPGVRFMSGSYQKYSDIWWTGSTEQTQAEALSELEAEVSELSSELDALSESLSSVSSDLSNLSSNLGDAIEDVATSIESISESLATPPDYPKPDMTISYVAIVIAIAAVGINIYMLSKK